MSLETDLMKAVSHEPRPEAVVLATARRIWGKGVSEWTVAELAERANTVRKLLCASGDKFSMEFVTATLCAEFGPHERET